MLLTVSDYCVQSRTNLALAYLIEHNLKVIGNSNNIHIGISVPFN